MSEAEAEVEADNLPSFDVTDGAELSVFPIRFENSNDGDRVLVSLAIRFTLLDPARELVVDHQPVDCSTLEPTGETPTIIPRARTTAGTFYRSGK